MRIPFPTKIPLWGVILFAILLCLFEALQGTSTFFVGGVFVYILVSAMAFNAAGGLSRPSGGYIFFQVVLTTLLALIMKAVLWEAADNTLLVPEVTIMANVALSLCMLAAAYIKRPIIKKKAVLDGLLTPASTRQATLGCIAVAIAIDTMVELYGADNGSTVAFLRRLNFFIPLAILIGTYDTIMRSGKRRSTNLIVIFAGVYFFITGGLLQYSKEPMFAGIIAWLIVVAATGFNLSFRQIAILLSIFAGLWYFLVPYAQVGRLDRATPGNPITKSINNLSRVDEFRDELAIQAEDTAKGGYAPHLFTHSVGFLERLEMLAWDDALIASAVNGSTIGYLPLITYFYNIVPHFLWPDKPTPFWGNVYAHRIGVLAEDDTTTGVSFSPVSEAFLLDGWRSMFMVIPFIYIVFFIVVDSVGGDVRYNPWGLFFLLASAHNANEGYLGTPFLLATFMAPVLILLAYFTVYVLPLIGSLLLPRTRSTLLQGRPDPQFVRQPQA